MRLASASRKRVISCTNNDLFVLDGPLAAGRIVGAEIIARRKPETKEWSMSAILRTSLQGLLLVTLTAAGRIGGLHAQAVEPRNQIDVPRIDEMPARPTPFTVIDWNKLARDYADLAFDLEAKGEYLPLIWIDKTQTNFPEEAFGLYVTVGDPRGGPGIAGGTYHIASGSMGAVLGSTLAGIDMRAYRGRNWVGMCRAYFNRANGRNVFMEHVRDFDARKIGGCHAFDFWGDVLPSLLAMELAACYPQERTLDEPLRITADQFVRAADVLLSTPEKFAWSTFDFRLMKPVRNIVPVQRDAAGGFAALLYWAHQRFGDRKYLEASLRCLDYLDSLQENPVYACMLPYGIYAMARANAEQGKHYDVAKHVRWAFAGGRVCIEGAHAGKWGEYDVSGLIEMQGCQRVYAMETFLWVKCLVPAVRYDPRLARPIGRWMQNVACHARYFYPDYLPKEHQVAPEYRDLTRGVIGTEALTARSMHGNFPIPTAETDKWLNILTPEGKPAVWPKAANCSLYGSSYVGVLGGIIGKLPAEDGSAVSLDCGKTDFYAAGRYPTLLVYNPSVDRSSLRIDAGPRKVDLYDAVARQFVGRGVSGVTPVPVAPDTAAVLVFVPSGGVQTRDGARLLVDGVVVDYQAP